MPRQFALPLILIVSLCTFAQAEVYKTVDKNGRVTYTDVPPADTQTKPVELKSINSLPAPQVAPNYAPPDLAEQNAAPVYDIQLIKPANGTTLMPNERSVEIVVSLNQGLRNGFELSYQMDGTEVQRSRNLNFAINEPPRGEHSISVSVVDGDGRSYGQSSAVTVMVMRPNATQKAKPASK